MTDYDVFKALGSPARIDILRYLDRMVATQVDITEEALGRCLAQPTVAHHMRVLTRAGLVTAERMSVHTVYGITPLARRLLAAVKES